MIEQRPATIVSSTKHTVCLSWSVSVTERRRKVSTELCCMLTIVCVMSDVVYSLTYFLSSSPHLYLSLFVNSNSSTHIFRLLTRITVWAWRWYCARDCNFFNWFRSIILIEIFVLLLKLGKICVLADVDDCIWIYFHRLDFDVCVTFVWINN